MMPLIKSACNNPFLLSGSITASYIIFYTAYDKQKKTLLAENIVDLVLCRRGYDWTLVEINKAISLSGLTTMLVAFLPEFKEVKNDLLMISFLTLWTHSTYSFYKFYNFNIVKVSNEKLVKKISIIMGIGASSSLALGCFNLFSGTMLTLCTTVLGIGHFYSMEIDYKCKLQVRPFAYLPFPLAGLVLYNLVFKK